jgi:hypothetical protein
MIRDDGIDPYYLIELVGIFIVMLVLIMIRVCFRKVAHHAPIVLVLAFIKSVRGIKRVGHFHSNRKKIHRIFPFHLVTCYVLSDILARFKKMGARQALSH